MSFDAIRTSTKGGRSATVCRRCHERTTAGSVRVSVLEGNSKQKMVSSKSVAMCETCCAEVFALAMEAMPS